MRRIAARYYASMPTTAPAVAPEAAPASHLVEDWLGVVATIAVPTLIGYWIGGKWGAVAGAALMPAAAIAMASGGGF